MSTPSQSPEPEFVAAWRSLSEATLMQISPAVLPGVDPHMDALRRRFLIQRLDYHKALAFHQSRPHREPPS